jgi:ribonuclease HII
LPRLLKLVLQKMPNPLYPENSDSLYWENRLWHEGYSYIAGVDEAGRGPWAGPVVAAAVILNPQKTIPEIKDSKKLTPKKRDELYDVICEKALSWAVGVVSSDVIDRINILEAALQAMSEAVCGLAIQPNYLLIDGNQGIASPIPQKTLIKGDSVSQSIGAASIIAKVTRDRMMVRLQEDYPTFSFAKHKGYGTALHMSELKAYGPLPIHRKSFRPVKTVALRHPRAGGDPF